MTAPIYEHPAWESVPEQAMHPGGLSVTEQMLAFCDIQPGARVLDIGCGSGATLRHIMATHDLKGVGLDISMLLLQRARRSNPETMLTQATSEYLPFASESLDGIVAECTLSIIEADLTLQECARSVKPGGFFLISDLYARNENGVEALRSLPPGTCVRGAKSQREILKMMDRCCLEVIIWQDCSEKLKEFSIRTLTKTSAIDPFDLYIAAGKAKLGYYFLAARKNAINTQRACKSGSFNRNPR